MHCTVKYSSRSLECQVFQQGFKDLSGNFGECGCSLLRKHLLSTFKGREVSSEVMLFAGRLGYKGSNSIPASLNHVL